MSEIRRPISQFSKTIAAGSVRGFHGYAVWLVSIRWWRFCLYALVLLIVSGIVGDFLPEHTVTDWVDFKPPKPPAPARVPGDANGDRSHNDPAEDSSVPVGQLPEAAASANPASRSDRAASASATASAGSATAARPPATQGPSGNAPSVEASAPSVEASAPGAGSVEIRLPPGADVEAVREAVADARQAIVEALEESRQARREAAQAAAEAAHAGHLRTRKVNADNPFPPFAMLFIAASAILKSTYKGRLQAEVKAAAAAENAESEQLKRQVVEARMAAMQAQVEPHFLFNTLASIDHLIETDPPRASQMQKNLIALLRASMPTLREGHPVAHHLGREMAVIRPYLEILKVRMEDRLQTVIDVPDGLLSADFPPMMIQGLVENAIKHGLEPKPEGGMLSVRAEVTDGRLVVTVADTGLGFGRAATSGTGVGLTNMRERLQLIYGAAAAMTVTDNPPSGTRVSVTLPYQFKARDAAAS